MVANLMNGKDSGLLKFDVNEPATSLNKITMNKLDVGPSRPVTCMIHDNVYPALIAAGVL